MNYLIIFNSHYWDRSMDALYKELHKKTDKDITTFRMPEDFHDLIRLKEKLHYDKIILVGDFSRWNESRIENLEVSAYLKKLFLESNAPRVWVLMNDLHHHVDDLLNGRKTADYNLTDINASTEFESIRYFDMLAWPFEYIEDVSNKFDIPENLFSENTDLHLAKMAVALTSYYKLKNAFPSRMDFYHCINAKEFRLFLRFFSGFKLMKFFVPGHRYPTRSYIELHLVKLKKIKNCQLFVNTIIEVLVNKSLVLVSRIFSEKTTKKIKNFIRFQKHTILISLGKFIWVDGSYSNYPVRKFFEIPMCNSLIVTLPNRFLDSLGFQDRVNCFVINPEEKFIDQVSFSELDTDRYKSMTNLAREIIISNHKPLNRINQLFYYINNYESDLAIRGIFRNNEFIVHKSINK